MTVAESSSTACGLYSRSPRRHSSYKLAEARAITDEQIAWWEAQEPPVDYCNVWMALGQDSRCSGWGAVRAYMIRWLLAEHVAVERLAA